MFYSPYVRYANRFPHFGQGDVFSVAYDCRLFLILGGNGSLLCENKQTVMHRFDLVYLPPALPYRLDPVDRFDLFVINFDFTMAQAGMERVRPSPPMLFKPEQVYEMPPEGFRSHRVYRHMQSVLPLLEGMQKEERIPDGYSREMASSLLCQCLIQMCRAEQNTLSGKDEALLSTLTEYLHDHIQTGFTEDELAADLRYHPYYLNRVLKKYTGETIHTYLLRERVRVAQAMLRAGGRSAEAVGRECGFCNASHFAKVFKRYTGFSPSEYRKANTVL